MPAAEPTYCVAEVREEAIDAWRVFCELHHVNRVALCEVIGEWMRTHSATPEDLPVLVQQWLKDARDLANARRRR